MPLLNPNSPWPGLTRPPSAPASAGAKDSSPRADARYGVAGSAAGHGEVVGP